jgi:hypothetical protein
MVRPGQWDNVKPINGPYPALKMISINIKQGKRNKNSQKKLD